MSQAQPDHPLGDDFVVAMNALHKLMADNPDPEVVQVVSQCLQALARLQHKSFQQANDQRGAVQSVLSQLGGQ